MNKNTIYFYKDRPLFGMDIGSSGVKVMQLACQKNHHTVLGYGFAPLSEDYFTQGEITNYQQAAESIHKMFNENLTGSISTNRVVLSVPAAFAFTRIITLPKNIEKKDLPDAVLTEVQQYLPSSAELLYSDYSILSTDNDNRRILTVSVQKNIIDSYMNLAEILGLEVVAIEPTTGASNRLFGYTDKNKVPTVLIDLGSISADITIYDDNLVVTGTVTGGGQHYTKAIKEALDITPQEAQTIKTRYGLNLSKKQSEIKEALKPLTDEIAKEVKRMTRYYEERISDNKKHIEQVILLGGGANIPGLSDFLTNSLRLPVRTYSPWGSLSFGDLSLPSGTEEGIYTISAGLALLNPKEPFS